jgi:hypothetical protein
MNKTWMMVGIVIMAACAAMIGWWGMEASPVAHAADSQGRLSSTVNANTQPIAMTSTEHQDQAHARAMSQQTWLAQSLQHFERQSGNITEFLQTWSAQCTDTPKQCDEQLRTALGRYPNTQFAAQMQRLLAGLPAYEQAMQKTILSTNMSPRERYDAIWQLRERMLGSAEAMLGFGQERAYAQDQFAYGDLLTQAANMSVSERQRALTDYQQQQSTTAKSIDGAVGQYEKAVRLMLIGVNDPTEQARIKAQLRQQYLPVELAQQLAQREQQISTQQQGVAQYQQELAQLNQEMNSLKSSLPENTWQQQYEQRLIALRLKHFP